MKDKVKIGATQVIQWYKAAKVHLFCLFFHHIINVEMVDFFCLQILFKDLYLLSLQMINCREATPEALIWAFVSHYSGNRCVCHRIPFFCSSCIFILIWTKDLIFEWIYWGWNRTNGFIECRMRVPRHPYCPDPCRMYPIPFIVHCTHALNSNWVFSMLNGWRYNGDEAAVPSIGQGFCPSRAMIGRLSVCGPYRGIIGELSVL